MNKILNLLLVSAVFAAASVTNAQDKGTDASLTSKQSKKAERAEIAQTLKAFTMCNFEDGLQIFRVERMAKNDSRLLARPTPKGVTDTSITKGKDPERIFLREDGALFEGVSRTDGYLVMADYKKPEYFANIRVDRSNPADYQSDKEILIRWINFLNKDRGDSESSFAQEGYYNGFESYSINRKEVDVKRDELGITLLFDDKDKIVVTIYFLNQHPEHRQHKDTAQWKVLRERFLKRYTACAAENLKQSKQE